MAREERVSRAAIEASAADIRRLVCKSLLGKAHTVMAEVASRRRLPAWTIATTGRSTFPTDAGRSCVNNWRMAKLHAKKPDPRAGARSLGRAVRSHQDGLLQRNSAAATRASRTSAIAPARDDPDLQDHGVHGHRRHASAPSRGSDRRRSWWWAAFGTAEPKAVQGISIEGGRARNRRDWARVQITSNSWEYTGDGHTISYEAVPSSSTWNSCSFTRRALVWPPSVAASW
jgi:succinate dehydrogenase / fumarate reductase flavoprotein subunit